MNLLGAIHKKGVAEATPWALVATCNPPLFRQTLHVTNASCEHETTLFIRCSFPSLSLSFLPFLSFSSFFVYHHLVRITNKVEFVS